MAVALASDDCAQVQVASARLLDLHPTSSAAHAGRGECGERAGRNAEAMADYDRARELLLLGRDDLFLAHASSREVKQWVDNLSEAAASVGAEKPRTLHP